MKFERIKHPTVHHRANVCEFRKKIKTISDQVHYNSFFMAISTMIQEGARGRVNIKAEDLTRWLSFFKDNEGLENNKSTDIEIEVVLIFRATQHSNIRLLQWGFDPLKRRGIFIDGWVE